MRNSDKLTLRTACLVSASALFDLGNYLEDLAGRFTEKLDWLGKRITNLADISEDEFMQYREENKKGLW